MKILLVDDEKQLTDALEIILKNNKYNVDVANDGEEGLEYAMTGMYDAIVLDIMLPVIDGIEILRRIRNNKVKTPVIMLSAKTEVSDKVKCLDNGADDYLTKPFSSEELLARLKAITRRKDNIDNNCLEYGDILLNIDSHELIKDNEKILLGTKEFEIMEILLKNTNALTPKEYFITKVWGYDSDVEYNTIEVYISFIRRKLSALNSKVEVKSSRGSGYKLVKDND